MANQTATVLRHYQQGFPDLPRLLGLPGYIRRTPVFHEYLFPSLFFAVIPVEPFDGDAFALLAVRVQYVADIQLVADAAASPDLRDRVARRHGRIPAHQP